MPNFYDQPAQSNIINTYTPLPFEALLQAGAARQGRYDQGLASLGATQDFLDQVSAIPGEHENYLNNARQKYEDISSKFSKEDLSQSYVRRQLKDEVRRNIDPSTINRIIQSRKNFEDAQKLKAEYDMRGLLYAPYDQAMDPALNGSLKLSQTYDYKPSAFLDPEKTAGTLFEKIAPKKSVYTRDDGKIVEVTSRDLPQLQNAIASDWRTYADTPQGQWVVSQYKKNNPGGETDPAKIVQGYLNDVAKRYVVPPQEDYVGFDPNYKPRSGGRGTQQAPWMNIGNVVTPGRGEQRPEEETDYRKNRQAVVKLDSQIELLNSALRNKNLDPTKRTETESQLGSAMASRDRLNNIQQETFNKASINYTSKDIQAVRTNIVDKHGLSKKDADITFEVGKMLVDTHLGFGEDYSKQILPESRNDRWSKGDEYLKEKHPNLSNKERRKILNASEFVYDDLRDLEPSTKEKREAFKDFAKESESHPGVIPYTTSERSGVEYVYNGATGEFDTPSAAQQVLRGIKNNPDVQKLEVYDGKNYVTVGNQKSSKKIIDEFNAGKKLTNSQIPIMPNKDGDFQLEFRIEDKDGKMSERVFRSALSDDSQLKAFGNDYKRMSNIYNTGVVDENYSRAYIFNNPSLARAYAQQKGQDIKQIPFFRSNGDFINLYVKEEGDGNRAIYGFNEDGIDELVKIDMGDGSEPKPLNNIRSDEEAIQRIYELRMNQDPRVIQEVNSIVQNLTR